MKPESQFDAPIPAVSKNDPFPHTWPNEADARYQVYADGVARRKPPAPAKTEREGFGPGYAYQTLGDFIGAADHQKMWIIKGAVAWGETSAWIGPPGSLKSALMSDLAISSAFGRDWHGQKSKGRVGVIYFALERADLVRRRIEAQIARAGISVDPEQPGSISIVSSTIDLFTPESVAKVVRTVKNAEEFTGEGIGVIIFDTFAKLMAASGGDEDKAKDQGKVFANIERIKEKLGRPHVALVGHTGKDESRGARGSNAILGDADVMVTISGEDIKTATVTKANDMAEGPLFSFKSEVHQFGVDEDGDPITVNIVSGEEVVAKAPTQSRKSNEPKLSTNQRVMLRLLADAGPSGLSTEAWSELAKEQGITVKQRQYDLRMSLKDKGMVREYAGIWRLNG